MKLYVALLHELRLILWAESPQSVHLCSSGGILKKNTSERGELKAPHCWDDVVLLVCSSALTLSTFSVSRSGEQLPPGAFTATTVPPNTTYEKLSCCRTSEISLYADDVLLLAPE